MKLEQGERIEDLQCKGLKIIQNKSLYTFSSDAVILANFLKIKAGEVGVEIGGGSGVISILASAKNNFKEIKIFEIQPKLQNLCEKNIKLNNLSEKIELIKDDVKNYKKYLSKEVDVVFSNPPYFKVTKDEQDDVKKIARQEVCLLLDDLLKVTAKLLKFGGRFYCVYAAERSAELISKCCQNGLEVKKMFFTENGKKKISLVVIEAVKGAKAGVVILPNLVTNQEDGKFLEELHTKKFCK